MRIGFTAMNTPEDPRPDVLGRELEARGYDSLWYGEHSHIPVARRTPYPAGGELPGQYIRMMNPFVALMLAATATEHLLLGTGVALPLEHDVFDLAKTIATLDHLSGGRLLLGVGVGWNEEELANHRPTVPWTQRYSALGDCIGALRALWRDEESEYHGRFYDFDPVWSFPKPVQRPNPPVLSGTAGRIGTIQAVAWADGWMPMDVGLGDVPKKVGLFRRAAEDAGRDPHTIPITIVTFGDPRLADLATYRDLGIERVVVGATRTGWDDPATILPFLDTCASMMSELG
jgi:probable F420-dependent oxidoreductase